MLDARHRKVLGDLRAARGRMLLVALAIALALCGADALLDTWAMLRHATVQGYLASQPVSATLALDRVDAGALAAARALDGVAGARARRLAYGAVRSGVGWTRAALYAFDDFEQGAIGRIASEQGDWPPRDGQIAIEHSSLELSGSGIGETASVSVAQREAQPLVVGAIVRDVSQAPGWMEHLVYGYVTPATLAALGAEPGFDELQIRVRDPDADRDRVRLLAYALKARLEQQGYRVRDVDVPVPNQHVHAAQMDSLLLTQAAFAALTLLVAMFLVVNLVNALLARQVREIGVMKVLGGSPRQIAAMYLALALLLGLAATLLAVPAALALARPYATMKVEMLNFPASELRLPWWPLVLEVALGALLPVLAAALPVRRACRMAVGAALRDVGIATADGGLGLARRVARGGNHRPLLLALDNAFRKRQRLVLTLLALSAGGAVFLGAQNLRLAVIGSVDRLFEGQRFDFALRLSPPRPIEQVETLARAVDGVGDVEAWASVRAAHAHADGTVGDDFSLVGVQPDSTLVRPIVLAGRLPAAPDELVVSRALQRDEPTLVPDARVELEIGRRRSAWRVVGVVDAGPQSSAYAPRAAVSDLTDGSAGTLVVRAQARGEGAQLDLIRRMREAFEQAGMPVGGSQRIAESRRVVEDHLLMVVQFLGAMGWVMVAVGGMGLASSLGLAVLERTRELGILRAIGARHAQIVRLVVAEGVAIALMAWLLALPLSIPMSLLLGEAFGRVMFLVPARGLPAPAAVLAWLLLALGLALLASAWPARRAARLPVARALGYE